MFGNSSNTNTSNFSSGLFGQNNQNQSQGSLFGSTNALGNKPMFGSSTSTNNGSSGGLFGNALQPSNTNTGGGLFGGSQNNNTGGSGGLFGNVLNKENQGMGGMGNNGLFGGNKENSGGLFGNGGGMGLGGNSMPGTVGYHYDASKVYKNTDGLYVQSVTGLKNYAGKSLDELRTEDYLAMKNNQIPDQRLTELQNQWKKNQECGGLAQSSSSGIGGMFGNSNGNQNQNQGGGLFGGNNNNNSTGSGLFGGSTQNNNTGGGLFGSNGNNNNNNNNTSGGLFGGQQNNNSGLGGMNNQSSSLFGGSGQTQSGGLFGQSGGNTTGQSTGGLFGGNNNAGQSNGGGLFGNSGGNTTGQSTGGLFGNSSGNTTGQSTGGLFGGNNSALGGNSGGLGVSLSGGSGSGSGSGGLFGNNNNNNSGSTGGLFGQNQGTGASTGGLFSGSGNQSTGTGAGTGTGSGGLFGSNGATGQQQQNKTGGLFGNSSGGLAGNTTTGSTGASTGGLFGNSGANKQGGLFGNSSSTTAGTTTQGSGGLFGGQTQSGATNTTSAGTGGLFSGSTASGQSKGGLFSGSTTGTSTGQSGGLFSSGGQSAMPSLTGGAAAQNGQNMQGQGLEQGVNSMTDIVAKYFGAFGQSLSAHEKARELYGDSESESLFSTVMKTKFPSYNPYGNESKSKRHYDYSNQKLTPEKKAQWGSKGKSSLSFMNSTEKEDELAMNLIFKPQTTDMKRIKVNAYEDKQSPEKISADLTRVYDSVSVYVVFQRENSGDKVYTFDVSLTSTCSEIKNYILKQVLNSEGLNFFHYKLLYKNKILKGQSIVKDIGLMDKDKLYLIPDLESFGSSQVSTISSETSRKSLAPENLIPLLSNNNQTVPSMLKLSRMSEDELANVENFVIYNENARITFPGKTDLRGMNLNELVVLGHRAVEVYPEDGNIEPPQVGTGLNKAAIIEFYKWPLPKKYHNNVAEYISKLKRQSKAQNVQYKGYDAAHEMLVVSVANFSSKNHM